VRLLDAGTLQLEVSIGSAPTEILHAVLSHAYMEDDEIIFQDMHDISIARYMTGFTKIEMAAAVAIEHGVHYLKIDSYYTWECHLQRFHTEKEGSICRFTCIT
jgi:hypothetical protein